MPPGDLAQAVIFKYQGKIVPETGHEPVVVGELRHALRVSAEKADLMAHNNEIHGAITIRDICEPGSVCRESGLG